MNQPPVTAAVPRLEVFVLQHHGQDVDHVWQWPQGADASGFDAVLAGLDGTDDPDGLDPAAAPAAPGAVRYARCDLRRAGTPEQPVWLLANGNPELSCTVNHRLLPCGSQLRLDHGDEIELGLTRMVISLEPSQGLLYPPQARPMAADSAAGSAAFDLTALAPEAEVPGPAGAHAERYGRERSDFSDLISLQPVERHAEPGPSPEPPPAAPIAVAERPPPEDPLQTLHQQYLARLRDPVHSDERDHWQALVRGGAARQPDPMQQWMQQAGSSHSLDDLLGQSPDIASVINRLDALGTSDVLAPEPFDSVMHLFAPGLVERPAQESLESLVQHSLPGLTRREHHSMSLDSAMPFTGGAESPSPSPRPKP